jgi:hypothetical protein
LNRVQVAHEESIWLQEKAAHDRHRNESQLTVYYQQQQRVFRVDRDLTLAYVSAHIMSSFQSNLLQAQVLFLRAFCQLLCYFVIVLC